MLGIEKPFFHRVYEGVLEAMGDHYRELRALGMESIHLPVTDGTPPSPSQVRRVVDIVDNSQGRVFLHCGEGVGRAGTMSAAYKVTTGKASASEALRESLAIGVLTFEQVAFIRSLDRDGAHDPSVVSTAVVLESLALVITRVSTESTPFMA